ncbi:hypothetical protein [Spirosoma sp.]|uniref:hypothetical protein n=1 Tax=Spirosoma sp. TaxID=1899569 RepID=UPI0026385311|nr:hypothetical protein [Spirosoma sp.]MCX6217601.1 hypothetical protein [Spirosoma sp.]
MPYVITRQGNAIQAVEAGGEVRVFTSPIYRIYSTIAFPQAATPCVEVRQGTETLQLAVSDVTSINGATGTAVDSLTKILALLLAVPSGNLSANTSGTGTPYVAYTSQAATSATIYNGSGVAVDVQRGGSGAAVSVAAGSSATFVGITNTSQLGVRRTDVSTTPVAVGLSWTA